MSESYIAGVLRKKVEKQQSFSGTRNSMLHDSSYGLTRVISITSGKGGVGKTTTVVNLAVSLAKAGKRVLIFDADLGLANIHVHIGKQPELTLEHVFKGTHRLSEIIIEGPSGISIIPASSGVQEMCSLSSDRQMLLLNEIDNMPERYDYLLIDTQAGIGADVMYFNSVSNEILCVINDEPTSLTDAYALIKILNTKYGEKDIGIIVNDVTNQKVAQQSYDRLARAVSRFLSIELKFKGYIPSDPAVAAAIQEQYPVCSIYPSSLASQAYARVAENLERDFYGYRVKGGLQFFFKQIVEGRGDERINY